jgi:hypothetical protein
MREARPPLDEHELKAVLAALDRAEQGPAANRSAWRDAGLEESTDAWPIDESYALSPRSTRGATRA